MAIRPFVHRVETSYRAPANADVGVRGRRRHIYSAPALHLTQAAHVRCTAHLGTERWGVDVRDMFGYQGAVPRGPVMLGVSEADGTDRTAEYREAAGRTGLFGRATIRAVAQSALFGLGLGAMAALGPAGIAIALLHALPATYIPTAQAISLWAQVSWTPRVVAGILAGYMAASDWMHYRRAHQIFTRLARVSDGFDRLQTPEGRTDRAAIAAVRMEVHQLNQSTCWLQHQAASEYLDELQRLDIDFDAQPAQAA